MDEMFVVLYKSYEQWFFSVPFNSRRSAETHIRMYLDREDKDYITEIKIFPFTEEWINGLEQYKKEKEND